MNKYKMAIFDFDGTLGDTIYGIAKGVNNTLKEFNYPFTYTVDEVKTFVGYGAERLFLRAFKFDKLDEKSKPIFDKFLKNYLLAQVNDVTAFPGIYDLLVSLNEKNIDIVVYSNKPGKILKDCCDILFKGIKIKNIFGNDVGFVPKPDVSQLNLYLKSQKVKNSEVIYIGDSKVDIQFGHNLHCDTIACAYGYNSLSDLVSEKPTFIVKNVKEMSAILLNN